MINIAVLGYGVVGSGVAEIIEKNSSGIANRAGNEVYVKKILDIRDFPGDRYQHLLTKDSNEVFGDDTISIVVETIGGAGIAYEFTKRAIQSKKHVVTSNKELVATHGPELLKLAEENGVSYLFEASVGGGIPIIRPLYQCLAANEIHEIKGILNGTTNYILSKIKSEGVEFSAALKEAQEKGYAEANPTADVEGHDACRKIAILSSIAYNEFVDYKNIYTEGITKITPVDMKYAEQIGFSIKLIAVSRREEEGIFARVSPALVAKGHPLSNVEDVFNAIVVKGDAVGETMFYGRGAGKLPTASAVVADVIDIVKHIDLNNKVKWKITEENNVVDIVESETKMFVRMKMEDVHKAAGIAEQYLGEIEKLKPEDEASRNELAFITGKMKEKELRARMQKLLDTGTAGSVENMIRILE